MFSDCHTPLSETEIRRIVQERLAAYGEVESLHIYDSGSANSQRVMLATMTTAEQAYAAMSSLGLKTFGFKSLIITLPPQHE